MRNKLFFLAVIGLLAFFAYKLSDSNIITTSPKTVKEKPKSTTDTTIVERKLKKTKINNSIKPVNTTQIVEVIDSVFDDDPVVDADIILSENLYCFRNLSKKGSAQFKKYLKTLGQKESPKLLNYYKNYYKYCEKLNEQHPEYHLTDVKKLRKQKTNALATSTWGKIINGEINIENLKNYEIEDLLKQNSRAILSSAPKILSKYYQEVIHWDLEDALENHQYDYTNIIQYYAHQLYLCDLGSSCHEHSFIMATLCTLNEESCGMTYSQYIDEILTLGQQADIQIALAYFNGKYQ